MLLSNRPVDPDPNLIELDATVSSLSILAVIAVLGVLAYGLYYVGLLGAAIGLFSRLVRWAIRVGFEAWEATLSWAPWTTFLLISLLLIAVGAVAAGPAPLLTLGCAAVVTFMGVTACLAYMSIDIERYDVERGYKAVHNPLKGQELAPRLARYGHQVDVYLLAAATVATVGGFALVNLGLYESVGAGWYAVHEGAGSFADFLAYAVLNLLRVVDILDLASSRHWLKVSLVRPAHWQASVLIVLFRSFFTLVLLQQIFASLRQGRLLAETIADFWSPHEPIQQRARNALPQYGAAAIEPLLMSLRSVPVLTKEQRDQLPQILAAIGPSTIPALLRHLSDSHEHVRAVSAAALGHLNARAAMPALAALILDPSDYVRQSLADGFGQIALAATRADRVSGGRDSRGPVRRWFRRRALRPLLVDPLPPAVAALRQLLSDKHPAVRGQAAAVLGRLGPAAAAAVPDLVFRLRDADETVRCQSAEALGLVGKDGQEAMRALMVTLEDPSADVRAAAARGLGLLGPAANSVVPHVVPLLQDRHEGVRLAAADALSRMGPLDEAATAALVGGLNNPDNVVRAHAAEALGTIGAPAEEAVEALAEVLGDSNDVVRAKAAKALGKIGEAAADVAVPGLVRALRDKDSWVSALAAEALGEMGEAADEAVPALTKALGHVNAQVRANAAAALGKLGELAGKARPYLERAATDIDGGVRGEAVRALGLLGRTTPGSLRVVLEALRDPDPLVRAGGVEALTQASLPPAEVQPFLLPLLTDPNDEVKVQATRALARQAGADGPVVEGLSRLLTADDSPWVQLHAAIGLARLGSAAAPAGPALLRAATTAEASVREQAMTTLAVVLPPEAREAFALGLKDPSADVRLIASAGWMKVDEISAAAVPALVDALKDPALQVRANAARALSRLDRLPAEAVPLLVEATADPSDGMRLNAALALRAAPPGSTAAVMETLLADPNPRVRLLAAGAVLSADPEHAAARNAAEAARSDPSPRVRQAADELLASVPPLAPSLVAVGQQPAAGASP